MGPMAGIGDALNPGLIIPLLLSIAITLSNGGSLLAEIPPIITVPNSIKESLIRVAFSPINVLIASIPKRYPFSNNRSRRCVCIMLNRWGNRVFF